MNFKRFNGSTWETVQHKIYGSDTDSLTAFPAVIQASGDPLSDYLISGNTVQDGTPTSEAPVDVVGCGDKTGNLAYSRINDANISQNGMIARLNDYDIAIGRVESGKVYTANTYVYAFYTDEPTMIGDASYDGSRIVGTVGEPSTFTAPITGYVAFSIGSGEQAMLNLGSTALPYEPYGYKIPITCGGETNNIYLGQVETTRRIKKLVLTGEEAVSSVTKSTLESGAYCFAYLYSDLGMTDIIYYELDMRRIPYPHYVSDHFNMRATPTQEIVPYTDLYAGEIGANSRKANGSSIYNLTFNRYIIFCVSGISTVANFKAWLAAQYANGTPVTVWYVLAEPETAVVNEPMHKIGNYADTITMAQAEVAIPTFDGDNIISFGTTVKPSAMSATFKGWHPVQGAKQYDGSEWR